MVVAALGLAVGCATVRHEAVAADEPQSAWGAGVGPSHPDQAPGSRLVPEGNWPSKAAYDSYTPAPWITSSPNPVWTASVQPGFSNPSSLGPHMVLPATGGMPKLAIPLGGNVYQPVIGGMPVVGMSLSPH